MTDERVTIHYHRPPDRLEIYEQKVVERTDEYTITYLPEAGLPRPAHANGQVILDPDSPIIWFTYPGKWHDIGRFYRADGELTGIYANILTPVVMEGNGWETTDLFLDVWIPAEGEPVILDEDELREAEELGWVDLPTAERARAHAAELLAAARAGSWPPAHVHHWTLERVRERLG